MSRKSANPALGPFLGWYVPHGRLGDYTGELINHRTGEVFTPPSRTKQSFVAECDINNIMRQYKATGIWTHVNAQASQGVFEDLGNPVDYQEAMNTVIAAQAAFAGLPSKVRNRFENDPSQFLAFLNDPANQDEAIRLGLAKDTRPKPESTPPAPVKDKPENNPQK